MGNIPNISINADKVLFEVRHVTNGPALNHSDYAIHAEGLAHQLTEKDPFTGAVSRDDFTPVSKAIAQETHGVISEAVAFKLFYQIGDQAYLTTPFEMARALEGMDADHDGKITVREVLSYAVEKGKIPG